MDGRGRRAPPLKRSGAPRAGAKGRQMRSERSEFWLAASAIIAGFAVRAADFFAFATDPLHRAGTSLSSILPRRAGIVASTLLIVASAGYGVVKGNHVPTILEALKDWRDAGANAAGFGIDTISITGRKQLREDEILIAAGVTSRTSLLFLDVEATRRQLETAPWITAATVRKLYPGHLEISVEERVPFALWQQAGKISLIAADGTVLGALGEYHGAVLPLVVGPGAAGKAQDVLALIDRYPSLREQLRAAVLVAERRWNLRLKNGLEVRLPESEVARALDTLVALDGEKKLLSRDIAAIDLRLADRVTVRLSDEAAQAREQAEKDKKKAKGGKA
jgi:cell division protein FtsQ